MKTYPIEMPKLRLKWKHHKMEHCQLIETGVTRTDFGILSSVSTGTILISNNDGKCLSYVKVGNDTIWKKNRTSVATAKKWIRGMLLD